MAVVNARLFVILTLVEPEPKILVATDITETILENLWPTETTGEPQSIE